jgi:hypothetical protein
MARRVRDLAEARKLLRAAQKLSRENAALIEKQAAEMRAFSKERRDSYRLLKTLCDIQWNGL